MNTVISPLTLDQPESDGRSQINDAIGRRLLTDIATLVLAALLEMEHPALDRGLGSPPDDEDNEAVREWYREARGPVLAVFARIGEAVTHTLMASTSATAHRHYHNRRWASTLVEWTTPIPPYVFETGEDASDD